MSLSAITMPPFAVGRPAQRSVILAAVIALHGAVVANLPQTQAPTPPALLSVTFIEAPEPAAPPAAAAVAQPRAKPEPLLAARSERAPAVVAQAPAPAIETVADTAPEHVADVKHDAPPLERVERRVESPAPESVPSVATGRNETLQPPRFDTAYLDNPAPAYPRLSRRLGEEGTVLLRVHVDASGRPAQIELKQSSGHTRLDAAALDTVRQWRFTPARLGESAVAGWVVVPLSFSLRS